MLKITNINKSYHHKDRTINAAVDFSIEVKPGEIVSIIGPSGVGKSTILRCISGLEKADSGQVLIDDQAANPGDIGFVFQHFYLFPNMTVLNNLTLAPIKVKKMSKSQAEELAIKYLEMVDMVQWKDQYPSTLSGGQKQRVAIARTLCMSPKIVLFDEPTSALDPEMIKEVIEVIKLVKKQGVCILLVSHDLGLVKNVADRVIFLEDGKIIEDTNTATFFSNPQTERAKKFLDKIIY